MLLPRSGSLLAIACLGAFATGRSFASPQSLPTDVAKCVRVRTTFDGTTPLAYARVREGVGSKVYMHPEFEKGCAADQESCRDGPYVVPGDMLAIGKTCGDQVFVQYIGDRKVTTGWMRAKDVETLRAAHERANTMIAMFARKEPVFSLEKGRGVPVCEAYLQRLNQTEFTNPAYCDRPESDQVPGFAVLNRVIVPADENNRLMDLAALVIQPVYVATADRKLLDVMNRNGGVFVGTPPVQAKPFAAFLSSWRYDPPIDPANDGRPLNILMWNTADPRVECGSGFQGHPPSPQMGILQVPLALTADGATIDQAETIAVFGHPDGGYTINVELRGAGFPDFVKSFRAIGHSYGVFKYRDLYYFDTFFDNPEGSGDFDDRRIGDPRLPNVLGVFLRKQQRTSQVCEYQVRNGFPLRYRQ